MKDNAKPILFNTEMVRAILDGRKTVTRRLVKFKRILHKSPNVSRFNQSIDGGEALLKYCEDSEYKPMNSPYQVGDILYVRETWFYERHLEKLTLRKPDLPSGRYSHRYVFKADNPGYPVNVGVGATGWRPSIHMPKEAARIFLRVTDVRIEKLQDITNEEALKEGCMGEPCYHANAYDGACLDCMNTGWLYPPKADFAETWNATIKKKDFDRYGWDANPLVWVIDFERIEKDEVTE